MLAATSAFQKEGEISLFKAPKGLVFYCRSVYKSAIFTVMRHQRHLTYFGSRSYIFHYKFRCSIIVGL